MPITAQRAAAGCGRIPVRSLDAYAPLKPRQSVCDQGVTLAVRPTGWLQKRRKPGLFTRASDSAVGTVVQAVAGVRDGGAGAIGVVGASAPGAGVASVISRMAACGVSIMSGGGVSEQGVGEPELIL